MPASGVDVAIAKTANFVVDAPNTENLRCPFTVLVESPYADNIPVMVAPYASKLSMYAKVADAIVALLNLKLPAPGSKSVVVETKVCATTTAAPEFRTFAVILLLVVLIAVALAINVELVVVTLSVIKFDVNIFS